MYDVGAMNGCSASRFLKDDWRVYSFEPNPEQRHIAETRLKQHKLDGSWTIYPYALGNKADTKEFYLSDESKGISSLVPFHKSHKMKYRVNVKRLDTVMNENNMPNPVFLKIDTEGWDYYVLQGYPFNKKPLPRFIVCEFEDAKTKELGYTWKDSANYLQKQGYHVIVSEWYPIVRYGIKHNWRCFKKMPCEMDDQNAWGNFIAFNHLEDMNKFIEFHKITLK